MSAVQNFVLAMFLNKKNTWSELKREHIHEYKI